MPFLARRGSISTRAYGQLSKKNIPTSTTWSGQSIFDNNNDISLFRAGKTVRQTVSPFSTLENFWKTATTQDLVTWTDYTTIVIQPTTAMPTWGTDKYHVADASFRPWVQSYWDATANAYVQKKSLDGLATWQDIPTTNLRSMFIWGPVERGAGALIATGDTWWRNIGHGNFNSAVGQVGPRLTVSTDAGVTYTLAHEYEGQAAPYGVGSSGQYGNWPPYVSWIRTSSNIPSTTPAPAGIYGIQSFPGGSASVLYTYLCGSGGTLLVNDPANAAYEYTRNEALYTLVGRYVHLYKVAVSDDRTKLCVTGYGTLPNTSTLTNFAAASSDGGVTWALSTNFATLFGTVAGPTYGPPFSTNTVKCLMHDGTRFIATQGSANTRVASSTDGLTWTVNTGFNTAGSAVSAVYFVIYNGSIWLAGCNSGQIMRSSDFSTWTLSTLSNLNGANVVAGKWNGSKFCIVPLTLSGSSAPSMTSTDGVTWSSTGGNWGSIAGFSSYAYLTCDDVAGEFYALVMPSTFNATQKLLFSADGLTWSNVSDFGTKIPQSGHTMYVCDVYVYGNPGAAQRDLLAFGDWGYCLRAYSNTASGTGNSYANTTTWNWDDVNSAYNTPQKAGGMRAPQFVPVLTNLINPALTITNGGSGFSSQYTVNIRFSPPDNQLGWEPIVSTITISGGAITGVTLADSGAGYITPPTVTITDSASGVGATATCSFKTSASSPSVTMRRLWYWDIPWGSGPNTGSSGSGSGPASLGAGWYGYSSVAVQGSTSTLGYQSLESAIYLAPGSGDVTDATAGGTITVYAGGGYAYSALTTFVAENDSENGKLFYYAGVQSFGGAAEVDSTRSRLYWSNRTAGTDYNNARYWYFTRPVVGYPSDPGQTTYYISGKYIKAFAFIPIYNNVTTPGEPDIIYWVTGYTLQTTAVSTSTSAGTRKVTLSPYVRPFVFVDTPGSGPSWTPYTSGTFGSGEWDMVFNASNMNQIQFYSVISISSDAVANSKRGTKTIAWSSSWNKQSSTQTTVKFAFVTTDAGATWTYFTDLMNYLTAEGVSLTGLYWNDNEQLWVLNTSDGVNPYIIYTTPDFITYNKYANVTGIV